MKMAEYTRGPWRLSPTDDTVVIADDGSEIATIDGDYNQPETWPIMEANARLIAAAPEIADALADMLNLRDEIIFGMVDGNEIERVVAARMALSKAREEDRTNDQ